jgi:hypothetical protein
MAHVSLSAHCGLATIRGGMYARNKDYTSLPEKYQPGPLTPNGLKAVFVSIHLNTN